MAEDFGSGVSRTLSALERGFCPVCKVVLSGRGKTCSRKCAGLAVRLASEKKYNLTAFSAWTPSMAYALGLFFADGCLQKPPRGSLKVSLDNTDLPTVQWWHGFLGNPNKILCIRRADPHQDIYRSTSVSDTLGLRLKDLGALPGKSFQPISLPSVPTELLSHFVRGFFDGDGSLGLHRNPKMKGGFNLSGTITSNSLPFRKGLIEALDSLGIKTSHTGIRVAFSGSSAERFCRWIYKGTGFRMARKEQVWEQWKTFREDHGGLILESDPYESLRGLQPEPWHGLVGTKPDTVLAAELGISNSRVGQVRQELGIPVYRQAHTKPSPRPWHLLAGTMTDEELAASGNISKSMVCMYRKKMGIPSYRSLQNEEVF